MHREKIAQEVMVRIRNEKIKFVELQFMDIQGMVKTVSIPASHLPHAIEDGILFDGSSIMGYATVDESDLRAYPDLNTFLIYPWSNEKVKTGSMICDIYDSNGKQFEGDPRYILKKTIERAKKMGYYFNVGPELEFFLFRLNGNGDPTNIPDESGGYFDLMPLDRAEKVRKECTLDFEEMGFEVEASHHEVASGQHEIDLRYDEALKIADRILTLKHCIKTIAKQNSLHATFMPKPITGVNGTGMHIHQSLMDRKGNNVFYNSDGEDQVSDIFRYYTGGVLKHAKETCGILASWVNSYKRLVPGYEAPVYVSWAYLNRSALARVPAGRGKGTRLEIRNPDPAGNPYLQFSVLLASGLNGIDNKIDPGPAVDEDVFSMTDDEKSKKGIEALPSNLGHALSYIEQSEFIKETLGEHIQRHFLYVKRREWDEYRQQVTDWEIKKYLSSL
ncbi:MAG: type I glutamate--ammonia ligase [Thermoplasmata archaeon]